MFILLACLSIFTTIAFLLHRLILYPRFFSPLRAIPGPPLGSILAGQFGVMLRNEAGMPQRNWVKEHGPVVRVVGPIGVERVIFVSQDALYKILVSDWTSYPRPRFMRNFLGTVTGSGLLTVEGREHRQMRRAMQPAFGLQHLVAQVDMYYDAVDSLLEILGSQIDAQINPKEGKVFHMYEWLSKTALDIICLSAFGYHTDSLHNPNNELAQAYEELVNLQTGRNLARAVVLNTIPGVTRLLNSDWMYKHRHIFGRIRSLTAVATVVDCMHRIKAVSARLLEEKITDTSLLSDIDSKKDIMSILVRSRKEGLGKDGNAQDGYAMSDEEIMGQVLTFLGAGHETTASGLAWTLWLLASHPNVQAKLREEVKPMFDENNGRPDYKALKDMTYLDAVVMESLRLYPPVPMTIRRADKTDYIDGAFIPAGTLFYIPIRVVNTYANTWGADAEEFKPERWADLPKKAHLLTFLEGPHGCIGKTMAVVEMKAVVGALVSNFEFGKGSERQVPVPTAAITMKPEDGMPLRVRRVLR